jgi:hypothetical protein
MISWGSSIRLLFLATARSVEADADKSFYLWDCRFTLDDWHTTSEVKAAYRESLGSLPDKWRSWVLGGEYSFA